LFGIHDCQAIEVLCEMLHSTIGRNVVPMKLLTKLLTTISTPALFETIFCLDPIKSFCCKIQLCKDSKDQTAIQNIHTKASVT
jgi:hypothetical protein